jgi:HK97 family phage prohead protease
MTDYELRTAGTWDIMEELRTASEADGLTLTGLALPFDRLSQPMRFPELNRGRPFREVFHGGSFAKTLAESPDVRLLVNHDMTGIPLARTAAGTMTLTPDATGIRLWASLPDSPMGRNASVALERRDLSGMSIRFLAVRDNAGRNGEYPQEDTGAGPEHVRHVHEARIGPEISLAGMPAFTDTWAAVRTLAEAAGLDPDLLDDAFRSLRDIDSEFTPDQYRILMDTLTHRLGTKHEPPSIAQRRVRLAEVFAH